MLLGAASLGAVALGGVIAGDDGLVAATPFPSRANIAPFSPSIRMSGVNPFSGRLGNFLPSGGGQATYPSARIPIDKPKVL